MIDERIEATLEAELDRRDGRVVSSDPIDTHTPAEQQELDSLLDIADLLWEACDVAVPPLEQDATAIMLGLVPDPATTLDKAQLKKQRLRTGLTNKELATHLTLRGWQITTKDVFGWEDKTAIVAPALINAIAQELAVEPDALTVKGMARERSPVVVMISERRSATR